jgi:hypothetical protein
MQAMRDAGLRRLSGATVALTLASVAGVGVVAAAVKSATEHSASRSAPTSATTETGLPDGSQQGGTGGSGTGTGSGSTDPGSSGLVPDQSGSGQIQPPDYGPATVPGYRQPNASSGGS